nr:type II toxin-antitoxin system prevent-host-death family antitoxin [uncultured Devosia sp.]
MDIPISRAGSELNDLVRRAEAGEEVVLTREDGEPAVRLERVPTTHETKPAWRDLTPEQRMAQLRALLDSFPEVPDDGVSAARSQDFLYDENGLPK